MRIVQYVNGGQTGCGVQVGSDVFYSGYQDTLSLINDGERGLERAATLAATTDPVQYGRIIHPIDPRTIFGSGVNYRSHGDEGPDYVSADEPAWDFIKVASAIIGPARADRDPAGGRRHPQGAGDPAPFSETASLWTTRWSSASSSARPRGMFAARTRWTTSSDTRSSTTWAPDQSSSTTASAMSAKNFDTFCPMGPCIVTRDELEDWKAVASASLVNGELRQDALVRNRSRRRRRHRVAELGHDLAPRRLPHDRNTRRHRDCSLTRRGSCRPGDVVTVSADGIGELTNPVVAGTARTRAQ